jgi:predicted small lipoprotein YifL
VNRLSPARLAHAAIGTAAAAMLLAGCGQKGPLFLPDKPQDVVTRPAPAADTSEARPADASPSPQPSSAPPAAPGTPAERRDDESKPATPKR